MKVGPVEIECVRGDIAAQPGIDAVVNAANAELLPGGGAAGAIHGAAGPDLADECRALAPIEPGEAVITGGYQLPNRHVIHCLGPRWGIDRPEEELLAGCYREALRLADRHGLTSIAFPAISTGAFGYPLEPAARVAVRTVAAAASDLGSVRMVRFVLFSRPDHEAFQRALNELKHA